jgi:hypothetical protein
MAAAGVQGSARRSTSFTPLDYEYVGFRKIFQRKCEKKREKRLSAKSANGRENFDTNFTNGHESEREEGSPIARHAQKHSSLSP